MFRYIALGRENFQGNAVYGDFNFISDVYRRWIAQGIVSLESWAWTDTVAYRTVEALRNRDSHLHKGAPQSGFARDALSHSDGCLPVSGPIHRYIC